MTADNTTGNARSEAASSWRDLAVNRSLDSARERAEKRVQGFLDAALELVKSDKGKDFTVQEVVEKSGQSLRSFYQYFAGKHEILLALFEEVIASTAERLREMVDAETEPLDRLHCFVTEYYKMCRPVPEDRSPKAITMRAMGDFAHQLLTAHPEEASRAFVPLVDLFEEVLDKGVAAGEIRPDVRKGRIAGVVLESVMFNVFATTITGDNHPSSDTAAEDAEELWDFILHGLAAPSR